MNLAVGFWNTYTSSVSENNAGYIDVKLVQYSWLFEDDNFNQHETDIELRPCEAKDLTNSDEFYEVTD